MTDFQPRNTPLSDQTVKSDSNLLAICQTIMSRQLLNASEVDILRKHQPRNVTFDLLYLEINQLRPETYKEIALEFGRQIKPRIGREELDAENWTPKKVIEISLFSHKCETSAWGDGVLVLTHAKSDMFKKIYNSDQVLQKAKTEGAAYLMDDGEYTSCVFVDKDIRKRMVLELRSREEALQAH